MIIFSCSIYPAAALLLVGDFISYFLEIMEAIRIDTLKNFFLISALQVSLPFPTTPKANYSAYALKPILFSKPVLSNRTFVESLCVVDSFQYSLARGVSTLGT